MSLPTNGVNKGYLSDSVDYRGCTTLPDVKVYFPFSARFFHTKAREKTHTKL